jgi:hypothetical protein
MKPTHTRRRRPPAHRDTAPAKKESQQEPSFFGDTAHTPFFKPVTAVGQGPVQRKCEGCEGEEKVQRMEAGKEEEKVQRMAEGEEKEKVQRQPESKEEEKVQRAPEKEEEKVQRAADKEEEKVQRMEAGKEEEKVQRAPEHENKEEEKLQKKEAATVANGTATGGKAAQYIGGIGSKGQPMAPETQQFYENRIGADFGNVRIHTGREAAESAKDIHAQAYTYGNHIVFNEGKYRPESSDGAHLLAHELAHVVQQGKAVHKKVQRGFWSRVGGAFRSAGRAIASGARAVGSAIATGARAVAGWGWDVLKSAGAWVWDFVTWMPQRMWSLLKHIGSGIVGTVSWLWNGFTGALGHIWEGVKGLFHWAGDGIAGFFGWIWRGLQGGANWAYQLLQGNFSAFWPGLASALSWMGDDVRGVLSWGWRGIEGLATWVWGGVKGIARWAWNGFLGGLAWVGRLIAKMLDLVGFAELWTLAMNIIKFWSTRTLTAVEEAEARKVFGGSIAYWQVRIDEQSLIAAIGAFFSGGGGMGVTTGHTINFNHKISASPGSSDMAWLIHELTHVAQYTHVGLQYMGEAIHAQATGGYAFNEADLAIKNLADFNREQQGDIIRNYYDLVLYGSSPYAADYTKMRDQARSGQF